MEQERKIPVWVHFIFFIEGALKLYFMICCIIQRDQALMLATIISILALLRKFKIPSTNKQYLRQVILNEFFHNILFSLPMMFFSLHSFLILAPFMIHFSVGISELIYLKFQTIYRIFPQIVDYLRQNNSYLIMKKSQLEIAIFFLILIQVIFQIESIILFMLYGNSIRLKYHCSQNYVQVFKELKMQIDSWKLPKPFKFVIDKLVFLFSMLGPKH